jgi:hypothetical protein
MLLILFVCCNNYYGDAINKLPFGIHEWAQADRYALAINFYDNGMDFLHPATQNLTSQNGIVGVEFPVQAYLAAGLAHLFGRDSISIIFRLLDILIAVTGLYFLFRAVFKATRDFVFSMFLPVFVFASPVYAFYSGNYMPDPAAASVCFIALYCLLEAIRDSRFSMLIAAILLTTLATLIKASSVPYLAGIVCFGLYQSFKARNKRHLAYVLLAALGGALLIGGQILHIQYLNEHYRSVLFLSKTHPFEKWEEFTFFINSYFKGHLVHEYLIQAQYPILFFLLGAGGYAVYRQKPLRIYSWPLPVFLLCALGVFLLFSKQYEIHDYYFIATFLPLIAYSIAVAIIAIHKDLEGRNRMPVTIGLLCSVVIVFFFADYQNSLRVHMEGAYNDDYGSRWLANGKEFLNELHIPVDEHIAVADENPPNLSLVYFDRKGYALPKDWNMDLTGIKKIMDENAVHTLVMKAEKLNEFRSKDSLSMDSNFVILGQKEGKAVLRLKQY